jgi:hypothetical protein
VEGSVGEAFVVFPGFIRAHAAGLR